MEKSPYKKYDTINELPDPKYPWWDSFGLFSEPTNKATIDSYKKQEKFLKEYRLGLENKPTTATPVAAPEIDKTKQIFDNAINFAFPLISNREVFKEEAYEDPITGTPTVGTGFTYWNPKTPVKLGETITRQKNDEMLKARLYKDLEYFKTLPNFSKMNPHQLAALLSFKFNTGEGGVRWNVIANENLLKALNSPNFAKEVPNAISAYNKAGGKVSNGLINRRIEETEMWNNPYVEPKQEEPKK